MSFISDRRTLAIIIICLSRLTDHWLRMSPIPFFPRLMEQLDISYAGVGTLYAALSIALIAMQLPAGTIADRFPAPLVSAVGMGIVGISGIVFALAPSYGVALVARAAMGVGGPLAEISSMAMISVLAAPRKRGRTVGFVDMSVGTAYFLALGMLPLVARFVPFEMVLVIPAVLTLLIGVVTYVLMGRILDLGEKVTAEGGAQDADASIHVLDRLREILANRVVLFVSFIAFLGFAAGDALVVWLPSYLQQVRGFTDTQSSVVMAVMLGIYIPSALLAGRVSDAWKNRIGVVQVGSVIMILAYVGIVWGPSNVLLLSLAGLFGVGYAWNVGPLLTLAIDRIPGRHLGTATAVIFMFAWLGSAVAGSALGYLVDWFDTFGPVWVFALIILVLRLLLTTSRHVAADGRRL